MRLQVYYYKVGTVANGWLEKSMNIKDRLRQVAFFTVRPDFSALSADELSALSHCVNAARIMTDIYLDQVSPDNRRIYRELQSRSDAEGVELLRYFEIHGSPWDAYNGNEPFVPGIPPKPKFGSFYPADLTKNEWRAWLKKNPGDRAAFESPYTVIQRRGGDLAAMPYSEVYADRLQQVATELRRAAALLPQGSLRRFLEMRAKAFITNDYFDSDMAWVDTDGHPFEVTIGPYEVYFDELFGLKAAFEAFVALPDKDATSVLERFTPLVPDFDLMLTSEFDFKPKGLAIPLEVVSDVIRGGEAAFGYMFVAYNLPNDRRIHDLKGSKKVFSRTMMEAKFETLFRPVAERILSADDLEHYTFNNCLLFVLGHELAHGLGPTTVKRGGREVPFEVALQDLHSCLEEAKADMLGIRLLNYFRERGELDDKTMFGIVLSNIAWSFQGWRHGFDEAHARGHLIEYNWLRYHRGVEYDASSGVLKVDFDRAIRAIELLSTEFLKLQVAGDYDLANKFIKRWSLVPPEILIVVDKLKDIPKAVKPVFDLPF